jgi:starch synthase
LYGLRYGALPLVRRVGGLADTVTDADEAAVAQGSATGFAFDAATPRALLEAATRALALWRDPAIWRTLMGRGMAQSLSWRKPAQAYLTLYHEALRNKPG